MPYRTGGYQRLVPKGGQPAAALGRIVLGAYYRDDRVLLALGHEARAPFPKGYEVEQGDWSLLEVVAPAAPSGGMTAERREAGKR